MSTSTAPIRPARTTPPTDLRCRPTDLPCRATGDDLWFAESPDDVERAKALCRTCPARGACLASALRRREPWGVWGGEIFQRGVVVSRKRPRGRPRKDDAPEPRAVPVAATSGAGLDVAV